jgi:2-oxoglutarate dehydrogenase E2 component (dihydrolipoamide succinyltransferase)
VGAAVIDVLVPVEQEGTKAVVRTWLKQVGDRVEENDPLVELETDKVAMEVPAPAAGVLREILLHSNEDAAPGAVLGRIAPAVEIGEVEHERVRPRAPRGAPRPTHDRRPVRGDAPERETRLSPSVKRAVLQHDMDPARIEGTGRGGRITRADVDRAVEQATRVQRPVEGVIPAAPSAPLAASSTAGAEIRSHFVPHDNMRRRIAENMHASVTEAPHVTAVFEADFSAIIAHRDAHKTAWAKKGVKLTYTAYLVAAAAEAMKVAPAINSRWHADKLELYDDINIGVGTALGTKGLIVPVLRQVQKLSLKGIASGLDDLIERARAEKLTGADIRGGTFTISNHGVSGSLFAAPIIINQPQSAILGVGKLEKRVVVREVGGVDAIQIRPMAYVSLTIDHRIVDGHQTNAWLSRFVEILESWPAE